MKDGREKYGGGSSSIKHVLLSSKSFHLNGTELTKLLLRSCIGGIISINGNAHDVCCAV